MRTSALVLAAAAALAACAKRTAFEAPALDDPPAVASAAPVDLPIRVPAYGIVLKNGEIEVNIEAADAKLVRPGQEATAFQTPGRAPIPCRVARVLPAASAETGQAIAWLAPKTPGLAAPNDFVSADVIVSVERRALAVPKSALLIRDGKTLVVRVDAGEGGKTAYVPVPVETGVESDAAVQILSGLKAGDRVATQGAIGYAYPDFKAGAD
jgi:multidrug efflux pump subunit AcrA (membrane-fusion protein)